MLFDLGQQCSRRVVAGQGLQVEGALGAALVPGAVQGLQVQVEPAPGQGGDVVAALLGAAQVAGQRGVRDDPVELQAAGAQRVPDALGVGHDLGAVRVAQEAGQRPLVVGVDQRQVQGQGARAVAQSQELCKKTPLRRCFRRKDS